MISHVESYSRIKLVVTSYLDKSGFGNIFTPYFDEFMNSQKYYEMICFGVRRNEISQSTYKNDN